MLGSHWNLNLPSKTKRLIRTERIEKVQRYLYSIKMINSVIQQKGKGYAQEILRE